MTKQKFLNLSILSLLVLALLGGCSILGGKKAMEAKREAEKQEMIEIVESEEAKVIIEKTLKNTDSNAFQENGVIQSYEIDYSTLEVIPTGNFQGRIVVNDDENLYFSAIFSIDSNHKLLSISGGVSKALLEKLREAQ
ncbi:DUF1310 family protein [Streptococcus caprae]|uniref:DUF1310 family protein n=1 Tax=Streptococcus caprae TaxID=1640501 RepID=A0ABV8CTJ2_9STRE